MLLYVRVCATALSSTLGCRPPTMSKAAGQSRLPAPLRRSAILKILRRDGFARIINELRARKRHTGDARHSFIEARAAEFQAARCLFPAPPNCLPDSLALLDYLYNQGVVADLVIGVRMAPYGAHCWVQTREALLNEAVDYAASFTPILTA